VSSVNNTENTTVEFNVVNNTHRDVIHTFMPVTAWVAIVIKHFNTENSAVTNKRFIDVSTL